jgi:serine/threonine protein kinase
MIGKIVAQYRIDGELGRGGMGAVYRAFDQKLKREVALKVLQRGNVGRGDQRGLLLSEARAASPLNHPNIATIYEVGEHDDVLFMVMELVRGQTLREVSGSKPMRPRDVIRTGTQISEALQAAHDHAVIHGDIKPDNVIVQPDARIKLLDFGVARQFSAEADTATVTGDQASVPGNLSGTLAYMAPERFQGKPIDPRSDLYSLGVVLYEMAAGHRPFDGPDTSSVVEQILNRSATRLDVGASSIPVELARIVHKLLEKDPATRYQSAREVAVDLKSVERDLDRGPSLSSVVSGRRTVAVLPFRLLTPNSEDEYLSVALAEAVINGLSASDKLLLRPASAVMRYSNEREDPLVAARELNVDVIVEGSIQKMGPQMRAHIQVWKEDDGSTLLSAKHDGDIANLFELQDRIAEDLFNVLGVAVEGQESPPTSNPQAYELFLRAVERLGATGTSLRDDGVRLRAGDPLVRHCRGRDRAYAGSRSDQRAGPGRARARAVESRSGIPEPAGAEGPRRGAEVEPHVPPGPGLAVLDLPSRRVAERG